MGLNLTSPFTKDKTYIDVPASDVQPGSSHDDPTEVSRTDSIEVKPHTLGNIVPSTQG